MEHESKVFISAETSDGQLVGFAAGFVDPQGFYQSLRQRTLRLAVASVPGLMRRPWLVRRLLANRRRMGAFATDHGQARRRAELASIAVAPAAARRGIGRKLMVAFCDQARLAGACEVYLTTDAVGNEAVNLFYREVGLQAARTVTLSSGRSMIEYRLKLVFRTG